MDMESGMCDSDMDMPEIFRRMIMIQSPLESLWKERRPPKGRPQKT